MKTRLIDLFGVPGYSVATRLCGACINWKLFVYFRGEIRYALTFFFCACIMQIYSRKNTDLFIVPYHMIKYGDGISNVLKMKEGCSFLPPVMKKKIFDAVWPPYLEPSADHNLLTVDIEPQVS